MDLSGCGFEENFRGLVVELGWCEVARSLFCTGLEHSLNVVFCFGERRWLWWIGLVVKLRVG